MTNLLSVQENRWDIDTNALLYLALKSCGRADQIFYDGHDLKWFLEEVESSTYLLASVDNTVAGFGMCKDHRDGSSGELCFGFLPGVNVWKAVALSKMMIGHVFSTTHYTALYGFTAATNAPAVAFAGRVGMQPVAHIPEYIAPGVGAIVTYANKESWTSKQS